MTEMTEMTDEQLKEEAGREMLHRSHYADAIIASIEKLARHNDIKITVNFGAELANCHDALAELAEYVRKEL